MLNQRGWCWGVFQESQPSLRAISAPLPKLHLTEGLGLLGSHPELRLQLFWPARHWSYYVSSREKISDWFPVKKTGLLLLDIGLSQALLFPDESAGRQPQLQKMLQTWGWHAAMPLSSWATSVPSCLPPPVPSFINMEINFVEMEKESGKEGKGEEKRGRRGSKKDLNVLYIYISPPWI